MPVERSKFGKEAIFLLLRDLWDMVELAKV
jgi:hypothetical protein